LHSARGSTAPTPTAVHRPRAVGKPQFSQVALQALLQQ
jgi:hypothetical protein